MKVMLVSTLFLCAAAFAERTAAHSRTVADMPLGADDAGNSKPIFSDPVLADAFEQMGFDFLMVHVWHNILGKTGLKTVDALNQWADRTGHDYIINLAVKAALECGKGAGDLLSNITHGVAVSASVGTARYSAWASQSSSS